MTILERLENAGEAKQWTDNIPTKYLYSYGVAGERFFRDIKENGKLVAARCKNCKINYLPPRLYCEECFERLENWKKIKPEGAIYALTVAHISMNGNRLKRPEILALIKFDGVKGALVHRIGGLGNRQAKIGLKVKPRFEVKTQRIGSINDIKYFEPA